MQTQLSFIKKNMNCKILDMEELAARAKELRAAGKKLVATNGCFDLLHVGHVRYLQAARALGDVRAVGLNGDRSVLELKGGGRPINNERDRAEVLAALACVDYVIIFDEPTAERLVEALRPEVYVKGGDYAAGDKPLPEAKVVERYGGRVVLLPYESGKSTTAIINDILQRYC